MNKNNTQKNVWCGREKCHNGFVASIITQGAGSNCPIEPQRFFPAPPAPLRSLTTVDSGDNTRLDAAEGA